MKILQIIPAQPGWNVAYPKGATRQTPGQDEAAGVVFVPIACWALVETGSGNRVIPMSGGDAGAALIPQDPENSEALGVSPPGRQPRDWKSALPDAKEETPAPSTPRPSENAKEASCVVARPAPIPVAEPDPAPKPKPKPVRINDPEPVKSEPSISMDDVMDAPYSVSSDPSPQSDGGIPASDVFDLDF